MFFLQGFLNNFVLLSVFPVITYENTDLQKFQILKENKKKSGVYAWINNINKKTYIGSSVNLSRRLAEYYSLPWLIKNRMLINKSLMKNGFSNFSLQILEYCDPENCIEKEQYYINLLKPDYNLLKVAGSLLGFKHLEETKAWMKGRKVSAETRAKISKANIGKTHSTETRQKISAAMKNENHPMYGKTLTNETRAKMAAAKKGENNSRFGKTLSEETKKKLSIAKMGEKNPMFGKSRVRPEGAGIPSQRISVMDILKNENTEYDSLSAAAKALGISYPTISNYIRTKQKNPYKKRFIFKKI